MNNVDGGSWQWEAVAVEESSGDGSIDDERSGIMGAEAVRSMSSMERNVKMAA